MVKFKESSSESEDEALASEPSFRVRVCMRRVFGEHDVRARALVRVRPARRVRSLARRLRRLFRLPARLHLLSRGHLLPPPEPLALLRPDDPVEVVPADADADDAPDAHHVAGSADEAPLPADAVDAHDRSPRSATPVELTESKRRALSLLEQYGGSPPERAAGARPRRRRVRRRRRPQGSPPGCPGSPPSCPGSPGSPGAPPPPRPVERAAAVLRNDIEPRAPRVVRPLASPVITAPEILKE